MMPGITPVLASACQRNGLTLIRLPCANERNSRWNDNENPMTAPYAGYTRTVRITDCSVAPGCGGIVDAGLRQVTVTVSYRPMTGIGVAPAGTTKAAIVTMYVAKR